MEQYEKQLLAAVRAFLRREAMLSVMAQVRAADAFTRRYAALEQAGLTPLVVKGAVCRGLYPKPDLRPSSMTTDRDDG